MRDVRHIKGPSRKREENTMLVFLYLEASEPSGTTYRLGLGCFVPPKLASMVFLLIRLL